MSVYWQKSNLENFKPKWANLYQDYKDIPKEHLKKISQRKSNRTVEHKEDGISLRPSWTNRRTKKLNY